MNFKINKKYYKNMSEIMKSESRKKIFENNINQLDELYYQFKYDNHVNNSCNFYVFKETIDTNVYNPNKINIIIEIDKNLFESFVDSQKIKQINESLDINFLIEDKLYFYDNLWKEIPFNKGSMVNINHFIEEYEF